jgi:hypothetical protein
VLRCRKCRKDNSLIVGTALKWSELRAHAECQRMLDDADASMMIG